MTQNIERQIENKKCVSQINYLWTTAIAGNSVGVDFCIIKVPQILAEELMETLDCNKNHRLQHPFEKKTEGF